MDRTDGSFSRAGVCYLPFLRMGIVMGDAVTPKKIRPSCLSYVLWVCAIEALPISSTHGELSKGGWFATGNERPLGWTDGFMDG